MPSLTYAVVILAFRGAHFAAPLVSDLRSQSRRSDILLVLDSSPDDATTRAYADLGVSTHRVPPSEFDHGDTRNLGVQIASAAGADIVVMLSQDVRLASDTSIETLLLGLSAPRVAAAFGRQLPRREASVIEVVNRELRYPPHSYLASQMEGNRRYFCSNAWAAYRIDPLIAAGGFPAPSVFGEDAAASWRLQDAGFEVAYVAEAEAVHSHPATAVGEFRRFFDVGVASRQATMPKSWGNRGNGARSLLNEVSLARRRGGWRAAASFVPIAFARAAGVLAGSIPFLPHAVGRRLSHSPAAYSKLVHAEQSRSVST